MSSPEEPAPKNWSEHRFISFDGTPIFYRQCSSAKVSKGGFLVLHGMGEHSGRYREFAEALADAGFEVTLPDLRGFGQSGGKRGCLRKFTDYFHDLDALYRVIKKRSDRLPLFVLGHSFGGLILSSWLSEDTEMKARGLVLTSPNFGIAIRVPLWKQALAVIASYVAPDLTQDNQVDAAFLTHDTAIKERSQVDRFSHHRISVRLYHELIEQLDRRDQIAVRIKLPVLVLQAGDDRVVSQEDTIAFFRRLAVKDKQLEVFPGLYHEILNETNRRDIYTKISAWAIQRL